MWLVVQRALHLFLRLHPSAAVAGMRCHDVTSKAQHMYSRQAVLIPQHTYTL